MLYDVNLHSMLIKEEYSALIKPLREKISMLGQMVKNAKIPVIIIFEGWGASGKGSFISDIIENLDPRNFKVHSIDAPTDTEKRMPPLWRFWQRIPSDGQIALFDRSWYYDVSVGKVETNGDDETTHEYLNNIRLFERQLADNGYLIIKLFLHIGKEEQAKRFTKLKKDPATAWRVTERDIKRHKKYETHFEAFDNMLTRTDTSYAHWTVVEANDRKFARVKIFNTIISEVEAAIERKKLPLDASEEIPAPVYSLVHAPKLEEYSLDKSIDPDDYKEILKKEQKKLRTLHNIIYQRKIPIIIVYEGWDAAGKGGNIKRITQALDPRGFEVVPVAAPNSAELAHHYMWRFWNNLPKTGHIQIFDRSWYGRVMVERIEKITPPSLWRIAYNEICEFEKYLHDWGAIIVKFWIHIDKEEQLRRFTERQNVPEKNWKITDEDWRNREKWDMYETCCNDMLKYTSTDFAPWTVIESNDKKFARIKAIKTLINAIENRLDREDNIF
ncbi:MAG: polyphosphate:AMP phosphotransferase [Ruminococcaceae bacterium]|nr:polyphosphate:AMP phosphotransferase [Oscillospiraceae bacterium]